MKKYYLPISGTKSVAHKVAVIVIVVIQKLGRPMCIVPFTSKVVVQFDGIFFPIPDIYIYIYNFFITIFSGITTSQMDTDDLVNRLPEPIRIRVRHVFTAVLSYIFEMLTTDNMLTVPPDLTYKAPFGDMEHDFGLGKILVSRTKNI